jgi:U3 small nucleolar RNA-associated protein 10
MQVFARVIQLSRIEDTIWNFLSGVKSTGVPAPRSLLAKQCAKDVALLQTLCAGMQQSIDRAVHRGYLNSIALTGALSSLSFYTALILEVIKLRPPSDTQLRVLYSGIVKGLKSIQHGDIFEHWRRSQILILSYLSEHLKFSKDMLDAIVLVISKSLKALYANDSSYSRNIRLELVILLSVLSKSQEVHVPKIRYTIIKKQILAYLLQYHTDSVIRRKC